MREYGNEYGEEDDHDQLLDKEEHYELKIENEPYDNDGNPNSDYMDKSQAIPVKDTVDYQEEDIPKEKENISGFIDKVPIYLPTGTRFSEDPITSIAPSTYLKVNGEHETPTFESNLTDLGLKRENDDKTHEKKEAEDNEFYGVLDTEITKKKENEFNGVFDTEIKKENGKHKGEDLFDEKDELKDGY